MISRRSFSWPAICFGIALLLAAPAEPASNFRTSDITGRGYGDAIPALVDQDGHARTLENFKGHVSIVFFGFTHCPDFCPTALSNMATVLDKLGAKRDRVEVDFITVDPERDTPGVLRDYLSEFGPNFVGLTGDPANIRKVAQAFKVVFRKQPLPGGDYTMDHSTMMYVLDPQAHVRLMFLEDRRTEDIAHDILELLD